MDSEARPRAEAPDVPRQNQGKGRGQHPLGEQRGPAGVGSLEPTGQPEPREVARGRGQKLLPGPSADLGVATGSGALEGVGFACGSREAPSVYPIPLRGPSQPGFMEEKGYSHHGLSLARLGGGGGEEGRPRVVASAGLQYVRSKLEAWLCLRYKDRVFFFFFKII